MSMAGAAFRTALTIADRKSAPAWKRSKLFIAI
jgi:hypothetical protein